VSYVLNAVAGWLAIAEPALVGAGVLALPLGLNALLQRLKLRRLMPVMRRAFVVIDPLLNEHLRGYSSSEVRFALELVTLVLADGQLTREEVKAAVEEIERRYRPSLAAGKGSSGLIAGSTEQKLLSETAALVARGDFSVASLPQAASIVLRAIR
jgi:hypothetical protein